MTNEQTAVMLGGYLEHIYAIKEAADKIPFLLDGKEVEGVNDLNAIIKNVGGAISTDIDSLRGIS